jgi:uncharacterized membrane protein HdeD (DUF308 family)
MKMNTDGATSNALDEIDLSVARSWPVVMLVGLVTLVSAFSSDLLAPGRVGFIGVLVTIIAGVVVVSWPVPTLAVIAWIAGIYLITFGVLFCVGAFRLRQLEG